MIYTLSFSLLENGGMPFLSAQENTMQKTQPLKLILATIFILSAISGAAIAQQETVVPATKVTYGDYQNWRLLAISHRQDKKTLRAILGNNKAIEAARQGQTQTWPDGTVFAKVVWKETTHPSWPQAIVPGDFEKAEAMIKDSKKYASTGGWGFGYWEGKNLKMYPQEKSQECFACHVAVKAHDYVFTKPVLQ